MELKKKVFTDIADFNNAISSQAAELSAQIKPSAASTGSISKVYQHWADGDAAKGTSANWNNNILSDGKSDYFEGEVIPHVFAYKASNNAPPRIRLAPTTSEAMSHAS